MSVIFPKKNSAGTRIFVALNRKAPGELCVVADARLLAHFSSVCEPGSDLSRAVEDAFQQAYLQRLRLRTFSGNGDFCPGLVDVIDFDYESLFMDTFQQFQLISLTQRELQLCGHLWAGRTLREIGALWHRSESTVKKHQENLNKKLQKSLTPKNLFTILFVTKVAGVLPLDF